MTSLKKVVTGLIASVVAFSLPGLAYATITVGSGSISTDSTLNLQGGNIGIGTSLAGKALEINSATGANLRLTYNDSDGAATNYGDFSLTSGGDLTVAPSGGDLNVTGNGIYSGLLAVGGSPIDSTVYLNLVNTGAYGGDSVTRYGYSADLTATDLSNVVGGYFSAGSSYGVSGADHNVLTGVDANTYFSGSGRLDNAIGVDIQVANSTTGNMKDAYGVYNQILGLGGPSTSVIAYYADIVNVSDNNTMANVSVLHGKIRTSTTPGVVNGTAGFGTIYGINLSSWDFPGASVTTSYGIYMDTSIDIGTTKYALWSSSASDSYIQGDLGVGTSDPTEKLDINSNNIRIRTAKTPATSTEDCNQGEISWDNSYTYICIADDTWHRSAHATW